MAKKSKSKSKKKSKGRNKKPIYSIAFSAKRGEKKYDRGPSFGLWKSDAEQVLANGPVKDDEKKNKKGEKYKRLTDLAKFLKKHIKADHPIYVALFENDNDSGKGKRDSSSSDDASSSDGGSSSSSDGSSSDASSSD